METPTRDQDAYAAGVAAAQDLGGAFSKRVMHHAAEALTAYLEQRDLPQGSKERGRLGAIVTSFCDGFFVTLDQVP